LIFTWLSAGKQAVKMAAYAPAEPGVMRKPYDLILMGGDWIMLGWVLHCSVADLNMPEMDGLEATQQIIASFTQAAVSHS
jgi:CheY-like chemotaxis protein